MTTDKEIYDLIAAQGETLDGDIHIIEMSDQHRVEEEDHKFRVYHNSGYCLDVQKEYCCQPDEVDQYDGVNADGYTYSWYSEWDGFHAIANADQLLKLLKTWLN